MLSVLALTTFWLGSDENAHSALSEETVAALSQERWERRDPFFPLIEPTQALTTQQSVVLTSPTGEEEEYRYRPEGRRDPFRSVLDVDQSPARNYDGPLTPLELYEPNQLRLVGIMWNSNGYRALLETPGGMAYTARLGTAIGMSGIVSSVGEEIMTVRQSVRDIFGEEKVREVELNLYPEEEAVTLSSVSILLENQNTIQTEDGLLSGDGPELQTPPTSADFLE